MADPHFFGYGSLVNRATHDYPVAQRATLRGWRRVWCQTSLRDVAFLSVVPDADCEIEGLVAAVPGNDWAALDERERAYDRHEVSQLISPSAKNVQVYAVPDRNLTQGEQELTLLLSYIDVVVQGYLREFGEDGVARFFETTRGWQARLQDDRKDPVYPRHTRLTASETALVDHMLSEHNATGLFAKV